MIQAPLLTAISHVRHGFFTRQGGISSGEFESLNCTLTNGDTQEHALENRRRALAQLGMPLESFAKPYQVHGREVITVTQPWPADEAPHGDGVVTNIPGITLGITTADCAPVLLADTSRGVIGALHAGWRGALGGICEATVQAMVNLGADTSVIYAAVGPCIAQDSYEMGSEVYDEFISISKDYAQYFRFKDKAYWFDLPSFVKRKLTEAGLTNIEVTGHNTYTQPEVFFSYRRSTHQKAPHYGCQLSAITLI